jgi:hypothetical protein
MWPRVTVRVALLMVISPERFGRLSSGGLGWPIAGVSRDEPLPGV